MRVNHLFAELLHFNGNRFDMDQPSTLQRRALTPSP
jgi:hypothetical protein